MSPRVVHVKLSQDEEGAWVVEEASGEAGYMTATDSNRQNAIRLFCIANHLPENQVVVV